MLSKSMPLFLFYPSWLGFFCCPCGLFHMLYCERLCLECISALNLVLIANPGGTPHTNLTLWHSIDKSFTNSIPLRVKNLLLIIHNAWNQVKKKHNLVKVLCLHCSVSCNWRGGGCECRFLCKIEVKQKKIISRNMSSRCGTNQNIGYT